MAAALLTAFTATASAAQSASSPPRPGELAALTARFAHAARVGERDSLLAFFPTTGDFTWVRTEHQHGQVRARTWRFPARDARRVIEGPMETSFGIRVEGQPVGTFSHQVMMRDDGPGARGPLRWRVARGSRVVPVGDPPGSGLFVEWRREGGRWVISSIGDESFGDGPLPRWCC